MPLSLQAQDGQPYRRPTDGAKLRLYVRRVLVLAVPQRHAVTYVPPFAPPHRFAITGWLRDR